MTDTAIEFELVVDGTTVAYDDRLDDLFDFARKINDADTIQIYKVTRTHELIIGNKPK